MPATADTTQRPSVRPPRAKLPLRKGHYGLKVARLQDRLTWLGYSIDESNLQRQAYGSSTASALKAFQAKNWLPATGKANERTWKKLKKMSEPVGILPLRCTEVKKALCIDKTSRTLRLVVKGEVTLVTDARFGAPGMETGEGVFAVTEKSYNHTSTIYHTWMPRAMFFNGDEAVHYSPDFASVGYIRGSHGCVGVRDLEVATRLFEKVDVGTRVYVYWS
jgi:lipoprotein-anchoring transpeptidase ErfK/SrfK